MIHIRHTVRSEPANYDAVMLDHWFAEGLFFLLFLITVVN